jgi:hypothetical protein
VSAISLRVRTLESGDSIWVVDAADLLFDVTVEHDRQEQRAATLSKRTDAVITAGVSLIVFEHVGKDVAVRLRCEVFDGPEDRLADRFDPVPDLRRDRRFPIPLEQRQKRDIGELIVHQHAIEKFRKVRPDGPLTHTRIPEKKYDAGLEIIIHSGHVR